MSFSSSFRHLALICLIALTTGHVAIGAIVTLTPLKDNTLFESATGNLSNGQGGHLYVGKTGESDGYNLRRGLIFFDLSGIPAGAIIESVTFSMYLNRTSPNPAASTVAISLRGATRDWGEGASNADVTGSGAGAPAQTGDATWLHNFYNTSLWAAPGGDFRATTSASTNVSLANRAYTWSGITLAADVQGWVNDPASNFGWGIFGAENIDTSAVRFNSSESINNKPQLTITYSIPEPSSAILLGAGLVAAFGRRRSFSAI